LLLGQGYQLAFASNGQEALAKAIELTPDLILLDVMMPDMDGFQVCQQLRADPYLAEVPVIMITALDDDDSRLRGIQAGVDDFVSKPFNQVELQARIRTIIRLNRYRRLLLERSYRQQAEAEVHRRNRELTLLNHVILTAASTLNVHDTLYIACEALAQAFELPEAIALLLNQERTRFTEVIEYQAPAFPTPEILATVGQAFLPEEELPVVALLSEYLSETKTPLTITGQQADPRLNPVYDLMEAQGLGSLLIVPIMVSDQVLGLIELKAKQRFYFSSKYDLTLAQSIATAVGQGVETANLYQNLQHHAYDLEGVISQRTQQLQNERDHTQAILEALGEAVIVTDVAGTIRYVNPAALALTGLNETEVTGQTWHLWHDEQTNQPLHDEISAIVRAGQPWTGEITLRRKDGTLCETLLTIAPLFDLEQSDHPIGFVNIHSDITTLKEAERLRARQQEHEKQAALDRLRQTFLSTVNHEMRTPLALIFQSLEMLESGYLGEMAETQLDALMALRRQAWTLGQMVESLMRVAAFVSKQETVRPIMAHPEPLFANLLPLVEFKARSKQITVETDIASDLPRFPLDIKQMEEALIQIIDNAIKFNQPGGKIKITGQADEQWVTIAVTDTGRGIEAELMNRIWELFEQGVDPVRRAQEGLGLGLVLARYIVEAHQGLIEVETSPGRGSTFTIRLPRGKT
jgi:PAS domain S-box-containing protein